MEISSKKRLELYRQAKLMLLEELASDHHVGLCFAIYWSDPEFWAESKSLNFIQYLPEIYKHKPPETEEPLFHWWPVEDVDIRLKILDEGIDSLEKSV